MYDTGMKWLSRLYLAYGLRFAPLSVNITIYSLTNRSIAYKELRDSLFQKIL